ncbi:MAG: ribosome-associated translation inhibitor RaiA [Bacteroidota bacterium]
MRIETQSLHFDADSKLLEFINKKVNKLTVFFDRIIDAEVTLKLENTGQIQDKIAEIKLNIPGQILVAKEKSKTFEGSVDTVVSTLKRQLIKHKEKLGSR